MRITSFIVLVRAPLQRQNGQRKRNFEKADEFRRQPCLKEGAIRPKEETSDRPAFLSAIHNMATMSLSPDVKYANAKNLWKILTGRSCSNVLQLNFSKSSFGIWTPYI